LAMLGALYENNVRAVAVRPGLAGYLSILEDRFAYVPLDVIVPGVLEVGDIADVMAAIAPRALLLGSLVDGRNPVVSEADLPGRLAPAYEAYRGTTAALVVRSRSGAPDLPHWILNHL